MSFILDALRKSEHERQRSAAPGLSHVPLATPRRELPGWVLVLIGVLAAAVLLLGGAWWQSLRSPAPPVAAAAPVPVSPPAQAPAAVVVPASSPPVAEPVTAADERTQSLASAAIVSKRPAPSGPTLPSAAALQAQGISVPALRLELHAYSDKPAERFVFINGRKYKEGERLTEGPEVVTVEPNGVVLSQQGQRFMLAPE